MANPICVAISKCEVKEIFDKNLKTAALKLVKPTIKTLVDGTKGLTFENKCKLGWELNVTVTSLKVDDVNKPTTMEARILINGVPLSGTTNGFNATGGAKAANISAKKMDQEVALAVQDAVKDVMAKQVIARLLKA